MELEQPKPENSEEVNSEDDHHNQQQQEGGASSASGQLTVAARSYECTFCKRGFSNAQALGGHMNIHRKDKAKLRQLASSNFNEQHQNQLHHHHQQQQDILKMPPSYSSRLPPWFVEHHNEGDTTTSKGTTDGEAHQLRLFAETPPDDFKHQKPDTPHHQVIDVKVEKGSELDLELRLGPEPQDTPAPIGTRKFFY